MVTLSDAGQLLALAEPEDQQRDRRGRQDRAGDVKPRARPVRAGSTRRMARTSTTYRPECSGPDRTAYPAALVKAGWRQSRRRAFPGRGLGGGEELDGRAVQIGASYRISAFDIAQRDVAGMAQESSDALSARSVLPLAARVIMVHVDELPLKWLMAHAAGVLLRSQQAVELLLGKPVARDSVLPVGLLAGLP
jgi:hypothetical protein